MIILAIETSCDETAIAILEVKGLKFKIQSNIIASQVKLHQKYGGVYPTLAKREHERSLPIVLKKALKSVRLKSDTSLTPKTDYIAVTVGPGLEPCLWIGVNFVKELAKKWKKPIIPVDHIEAHIFANWLAPIISKSKIKNTKYKIQIKKKKIIFPALALIVSGGHTQLILMKGIGKYKIIGETRDDAAGECFDKTARILGLPYPGGPAIARQAEQWQGQNKTHKEWASVKLPRPMIHSKNYDFSFSGLKTAVLYDYKKRSEKVRKSKEYIREMAREIQQAVIDVLIKKTIKAAKDFRAKTIILGGGVAANDELRKQFQKIIKRKKLSFKFHIPSFKLCTDNAAMIAVAGYFNRNKATKNYNKIKANPNLRI